MSTIKLDFAFIWVYNKVNVLLQEKVHEIFKKIYIRNACGEHI